MSELSIAPGPGLTVPNRSEKLSGQAIPQESQFAIFGDDWLELQGFIGSALDLPITSGDFEAKYGDFGSATVIKDCIGAMKAVQAASTEFGDPKRLRAQLIEDPTLLASKTPPTEIYTHTVWMGQRVHTTAATIASGYQTVLDELSDLPSKDKVDALKAYLFDQVMGPIPLARTMSDEIGGLIKKLGVFEQKMNEYNEKLQAFTREGSTMLQQVDSSVGAITQKIIDLKKLRDDAWNSWRDFTIAAVTASVGVALLAGFLVPFTLGASVAVGAVAGVAVGVGLGVKAAQYKAKYNEYCRQIRGQAEDLNKKQRLRADLTGLNDKLAPVGAAMGNFMRSLQTMQGVWVQMNTDLVGINESLTEHNVGSVPFLVKAQANMAIDAWKEVDDTAKQFTVESLVDYQSIAFGDPMPERAA